MLRRYKARDYDAPGNLSGEIRRLNLVRRSQLALQRFENCHVEFAEDEPLLFFRKSAPVRGADDLLVVVNLDPFHMHHGMVHVPLAQLGLNEWDPYVVEDLLTVIVLVLLPTS